MLDRLYACWPARPLSTAQRAEQSLLVVAQSVAAKPLRGAPDARAGYARATGPAPLAAISTFLHGQARLGTP